MPDKTTARRDATGSAAKPARKPNRRNGPRPRDEAERRFFRGAELMREPAAGHAESFPEVLNPKKRLYLQALAAGTRYGTAARLAGVDVDTGYNWRHDQRDAAFQDALLRALRMGIEAAESELYRRGVHGYEKPVYQGGRLVGTVQEYDTTAAIFWLKGNAPEKYADRVQHSGAGGTPLPAPTTNVLVLDDATLRARLEAVTRQLAALPAAGEPVAEGGETAGGGEAGTRKAE